MSSSLGHLEPEDITLLREELAEAEAIWAVFRRSDDLEDSGPAHPPRWPQPWPPR